MTQTISVTTPDGSFSGFLALPASGKGPGLVIAQEIFGVNHVMKAIARQFADEGYVAFVPDLFWRFQPGIELGYSEADWKKAGEYYQKFDPDRGAEDLGAAIAALRKHPACTGKAGVIGFCLGGLLAYLAACRTDCDAAAVYYGVGIEERLAEAKNLTCPAVLHFAEKDRFVPLAAIEKIQAALAHRPNVAVYRYPGVDHAFARVGEANYHAPSAELALGRTLACLKGAMGPGGHGEAE